ncbi:MAG TPA: CDP-diacylglycerol--serine O-phosphatidyltransferase [Clostridium sp.]|jgi:CDP-diacylglycerol--serine O-phosphatidyltransferase|nr:CDP-diacylglycerol--serine O-phosphatidyltransferase [Clostridia bacterium]HCW03883.1 CDP-diacylglycerol--serine O-phosphatidyltransferase [Clostridium sp.]
MHKNAIPNFFTIGNLSCGILSILVTFQNGNFQLACLFILIAGLMDRYDGRIARLLNVSSDLGKELDSLADLVSFGLAPSMLVFAMYEFYSLGVAGYLLVLAFPVAGAYRLARYNCTSFEGVFIGIPITLAGSIMTLFSLLTMNKTTNIILPVIFLLSLSYLMVSKLKIKKV